MSVDPRTLKQVENLAAGLKEPSRAAEVERHYAALVGAMNGSFNAAGAQDALSVFEALGKLLGQVTANLANDEANGIRDYVLYRSVHHAGEFREAGMGAVHLDEEEPPEGQRH